MNWHEVDSSAVRRHRYISKERAVEIEYSRGGIYRYPERTPAEYALLASAQSIGKHVARYYSRSDRPVEKIA